MTRDGTGRRIHETGLTLAAAPRARTLEVAAAKREAFADCGTARSLVPAAVLHNQHQIPDREGAYLKSQRAKLACFCKVTQRTQGHGLGAPAHVRLAKPRPPTGAVCEETGSRIEVHCPQVRRLFFSHLNPKPAAEALTNGTHRASAFSHT